MAVPVRLNDIDPKAVQVELYADGVNGGLPVRQTMQNIASRPDESGSHVYRTSISKTRPVTDYSARVIPQFDGVSIPLENAQILWQR